MLTRLYVDNFRPLVNFEWRPAQLALLLGANGSGKSAAIEALMGVRDLVVHQVPVSTAFPLASRTRWEQRLETRIELEVRRPAGTFHYRLQIEHNPEEPKKSRVMSESLRLDDKPLMVFARGELQLHRDDGSAGPLVVSDWWRSGLGAIAASRDNRHLTAFKGWLRDEVWLLSPNPRAMSARTDGDAEPFDPQWANFASWLPGWMASEFEDASTAMTALRDAMPGFRSLRVNRTTLKLEATFQLGSGLDYAVDFGELSDGQRQLCVLHVLRQAAVKPGRLVILDEPDNFLALTEIQPWLLEVAEAATSSEGPQVMVISHHPEALNQLAPQHGTLFFRDDGPTRVRAFEGTEGLSAAEVIARGWAS